ncbi:MAG: HAD family hydrolase [Epsilonproteobacteria bacterium]|nr:hydrolase [Campylobacterota bacterium]NPA57231.1 HAD family hydrolase [Campylobacterota bacterium]
MRKTTVLFDLDGTLIDSTEAILQSFSHAFRRYGAVPPPEEEILKLIGHPLDRMFSHFGVSDPTPFVEAYKERYREIFKEMTRLLPHVREAVERAYSFARLGVVTTKTGSYSRELLEHFGLLPFFQVVIGREDVSNPKPDPEPILKALHQIGSLREYSWMVGDTCLDMEGARRAGIHSVAVTSGYGSPKQLVRCASHVEDDALGAIRYIKRFERRR